MLRRRLPLFVLLLGLAAPAAAAPPNLILLLADDMGYGDLSAYGSPAVETPNLDALATSGLRFTQFYAASAVCTPTRASVLTGRYPLRFDIRRHFPDDASHLPAGTATLPGLLAQAGYQTAHIGKWHLGGLHQAHLADRDTSIPGPHQHGFDHYLCQREEQPLRGQLGRARRLFRDGGTCLIRDDEPLPDSDPYFDDHLTDIIGQETLRKIDEFHATGRPFFLNVWWLVPHKPYEPAPEPHWSATADPEISDDQHRFRSMVQHLDARVGQIVAKLDQLGIRDNTLILFTSDNGGAYEAHLARLKGGKTDLHEGGIRVPAIANWPGTIAPGETDELGHTNDILPTFLAAADVPVPEGLKLDGVNLLPLATRGEAVPDAERWPVFWQIDLYRNLQRHEPKPKPYATEAVRRGKWKLLARDGVPVELFDLDADLYETRNLLGEEPRVAAELAEELVGFLAAPRNRDGFPAE